MSGPVPRARSSRSGSVRGRGPPALRRASPVSHIVRESRGSETSVPLGSRPGGTTIATPPAPGTPSGASRRSGSAGANHDLASPVPSPIADPNGGHPDHWVRLPTLAIVRPSTGPVPDANLDLASGLNLVGMPQRQARLYLALSREPQTAKHAADMAGFHRATAYRLIVRLLERGLITGDGGSPQRFQAAPPALLLARLEGFLREEADLCASLTRAYGRWGQGDPPGPDAVPTREPAPVVSVRRGAWDPALAEIEATQEALDLVVRTVGCSVAFRTGLLRTLGNLMRRGVRIRMLTDATAPDQRFVAALAREGGDRARLLNRRIVAPVGAHYYLRDKKVAVRMPALSLSGRLPGIALVERDRVRVQAQVERFESLWNQASESFGPARSTRAYAWNRAAAMFRSKPDDSATPIGHAPNEGPDSGFALPPMHNSTAAQR